MAIGANSYGTTEEVAALVPRYAKAGGADFATVTNPTLARVEKLIDRVSAQVNAYLSTLGFSIPVSQADSKLVLDNIVVEIVTAMVEGIRGTGRYAPGSKAIAKRGLGATVSEEIRMFLDDIAPGIEELGATRDNSILSRIGYRGTDASGDEIAPLFQREAHGATFKDWDV